MFSGAFLCFFDLICDLVMVREFTMNKQYKSAQATIITLAISLGFQLIIVYGGVNMKLRKRVIVRELLYVILCVKPGIDAYRVVTKKPQVPNTAISPKKEMIYIRGIELFVQCIPGVFVQSIAFVTGQQTAIAAISLFSGLLTAAFISASISIEKDIGAEQRKHQADFCGFLPLKSMVKTCFISVLVLLIAFC
ncbi:hypothetical protein TL16_g11982 [Triparma laevis f. inornata]|uniref:Uncharacterized protein n=1 Tax=Triparma laevis f. inornata TaxID=1714386 RepID=A0A9W7EVB4_9STRA|nr:hypothetical protein TL16_g11982 [Triparma laevis f. inornata]